MEWSELTDEALLAEVPSPLALAELYQRHVAKVTSFAARRCSTPHEVPDLVAAVWLEVIQSAHGFDPRRGRALPWILGVAANLTASNERRSERERDAISRLGNQRLLDQDDYARLEREIDAARTAALLRDVLSELPLGERLVAELVMIDGLSPQDASHALGIGGSTARMRLARARSKLRRDVAPFLKVSDEPNPLPEVSL